MAPCRPRNSPQLTESRGGAGSDSPQGQGTYTPSPSACCPKLPWLIKHVSGAPGCWILLFTAASCPRCPLHPSCHLWSSVCCAPCGFCSLGVAHGAVPVASFCPLHIWDGHPSHLLSGLNALLGSESCFPGCSCPLSGCFGLFYPHFPRPGLYFLPTFLRSFE